MTLRRTLPESGDFVVRPCQMAKKSVVSLANLAVLVTDEFLFFFGHRRGESKTVTSDSRIGSPTCLVLPNEFAPEHSVKRKPFIDFTPPSLFDEVFTVGE